MWISLEQASKLTGRSLYTLRDWSYQGLRVRHRTGGVRNWQVNVDDLRTFALQRMQNYRDRPFIAGPGRGHKKHDQHKPTQ